MHHPARLRANGSVNKWWMRPPQAPVASPLCPRREMCLRAAANGAEMAYGLRRTERKCLSSPAKRMRVVWPIRARCAIIFRFMHLRRRPRASIIKLRCIIRRDCERMNAPVAPHKRPRRRNPFRLQLNRCVSCGPFALVVRSSFASFTSVGVRERQSLSFVASSGAIASE